MRDNGDNWNFLQRSQEWIPTFFIKKNWKYGHLLSDLWPLNSIKVLILTVISTGSEKTWSTRNFCPRRRALLASPDTRPVKH